jgi:hypothetical protein
MLSRFDRTTLLQHHDLIGAVHQFQPMRDDQYRPIAQQPIERVLKQRFALRIQMRGGFIEDEKRRVFEACPRDGEPLLLPAAESRALLSDRCVIALRQLHDEFMRVRGCGSGDHFVECCRGFG